MLYLLPLVAAGALIAIGLPGELWLRSLPGAALLGVPLVLIAIASRLAHRKLRQADRHQWGKMKLPAGEWAQKVSTLEGIGVEVAVGKSDAYLPGRDRVDLKESTFAETTVRAYAVAAHELGHAQLTRRRPLLTTLALYSRSIGDRMLRLAIMICLANLFVQVPGAMVVATAVASLAAVAAGVICLEEGLATLCGRRLLKHAHMTQTMKRGAAVLLLWFLLSYVASFVGATIVSASIPWLVPNLGAPIILSHFGGWAAIPIALTAATGVLLSIVRLLAISKDFRKSVGGLMRFLSATLLILAPIVVSAMTPHALDAGYRWLVLAAMIPVVHWVMLVYKIISELLVLPFVRHELVASSLPSRFRMDIDEAEQRAQAHRREGGSSVRSFWVPSLSFHYWHLPLLVALAFL